MITEQRSTTASENLQEILDAGGSAGQTLFTGQQQYMTPRWFAEQCQAKLGITRPATIIDPQVGDGALVALDPYAYGCLRFGVDIDNRLEKSATYCNLVIANIVKVDGILQDIAPDIRFLCANANPPFDKRWKVGDGSKTMDSTWYTWDFVTRYGTCGYFIANDKTIRELGLNTHLWAFDYETRKASDLWKGLSDSLTIGVVFWRRPLDQTQTPAFTPAGQASAIWEQVKNIVNEEKVSRPDFNIYLDDDGSLRTYLSFRKQCKLKLTQPDIVKLHKINHCHPLTLTTEKESRVLMRDLVECGFYTIQPEAKAAIDDALAQVNTLACPIMPVTDFEHVAYADEEDELACIKTISEDNLQFTAGKRYALTTGSYKFTEKFTRNKVHFNEETQETYTREHDCQLSGSDRYIQFNDDKGRPTRFMDRPRESTGREYPESRLWEIFQKPDVKTVAELKPSFIEQNLAVLRSCELMSNYRYYVGQGKYLSRIATKDCGLAAAATGTGKTLMAISLLAMKGPTRALIIAPQGTMRSSEVEDDDEEAEEASASQWIQELNRFAPFLQVWEIFSYADFERILSLNGGELPPGVYVSYYQAMFQNGAKERCPQSWDDEKLNKYGLSKGLGQLELMDDKLHWCDSVGKEVSGIRCILEPCLATMIGHQFDMVMLDEAHVACNLGANLTQMLIRMQPKYRWALTATPIPNVVDNLFSIAGWICVDDWYKGDRRNAAWPYARHEQSRFTATFRTMERDYTQEAINVAKDPKNRGACIKDSPMISSPARLLKLLKPWMAYIGKADVNPDYIPPKIVDVRVAMGREQSVLYGHFLDRANIEASHPLVRARKQGAYLRGICCDPMHFRHGGPKVSSNLNPKVIAILELVRDILAAGEQVVIINSRVGLSDTLQEKLVEAGVPISRIDSTIPAEQHAYQANLFKKGKARVKLMGIKCASAYSFDACENEIIGSIEYSPGPLTQATGRIDRVTNKVQKKIYCILNKNSIEEIMFDTVATKDDAATICLKGQRVPRTFKPVDGSEILASAIEHFDLSGSTPESECEEQWPKLRKRIADALLTNHKP